MLSSSLTINRHIDRWSIPFYESGNSVEENTMGHYSSLGSEENYGQLMASAQNFDYSIFPTNLESPFHYESHEPFGEKFFIFFEKNWKETMRSLPA